MRKSLLAKVHIAKKSLGLSDAAYRALLNDLFGEESAAALTVPQLCGLCDHFDKLGFQASPSCRASGSATRCSEAQIRTIKALWNQMARHKGWRSLERWLEKYWKVSKVQWLRKEDASKAIGVLQREVRRLHG